MRKKSIYFVSRIFYCFISYTLIMLIGLNMVKICSFSFYHLKYQTINRYDIFYERVVLILDKIEEFQQMIHKAKRIVFLGGAGVSTESGIPDFRSEDGLYRLKYPYSPEEMLSNHFFMEHPEEFYSFYKEKVLWLDAKPNVTHIKLAQWEEEGKLSGIVTQNIDGLHQLAGSKCVLELHGSIYRNYCMKCRAFYDVHAIKDSQGIPLCGCGGMIKPDVVLYEESLDEMVVKQSILQIQQADLLIVGGTSLSVYPAASFIQYFCGEHLVMINRSKTSLDEKADLILQKNLGTIFSQI